MPANVEPALMVAALVLENCTKTVAPAGTWISEPGMLVA